MTWAEPDRPAMYRRVMKDAEGRVSATDLATIGFPQLSVVYAVGHQSAIDAANEWRQSRGLPEIQRRRRRG